MMKCAIYARVSTDEQGTSIINQREYFKDYIQRNNFEIFDVYSDEAFSGTETSKRLSFQRLIEDGKNKRYDVLLAKSYSRFGRNQRETLNALAELFEHGIRIIFVEDGLDSLRDKGQFGLFAWLAEQEARKISERIKMTWQLYNKVGRLHNCNAPLGYDYNKEQKNFVVNEREAELVRLIFNMYLQGNGIRRISIYLNENGITTKNGHNWSHSIVSQTLTNEFYIGTLTQGKRRKIDVTINKLEIVDKKYWFVHKNNHEPIIDEQDFRIVQDLYKKRSALVHENRRSRHSNRHLYSNVLKCKCCGASFTFLSKRVENYTPRYSCIAYEQKGVKICGHKRNTITEQAVTAMIKAELASLSGNNFQVIREHFKAYKNNRNKNEPKSELKRIEKQIEEKTLMSLKLLDAYTKGIVGDAQFKLQNESIEKDLQSLIRRKEDAIEQTRKIVVHVDEEKEATQAVKALLAVNSEQWTNEMVKRLMNRIEVNKCNQEVDIFFHFQIPK